MSERTRVAVLGHTAELGGAELALVRLLDAMSARFEVHTVLFADGPLVERLRRAGHPVHVLALPSAVGTRDRHTAGRSAAAMAVQALGVLPFTVRLARLLRSLDADLVCTTTLKAHLAGVPAARLAGRPLVWHVHDRISGDYLPMPAVRLLRALARRMPTAVVANSEATAATLRGARNLVVAYPGLAPDQVAVAPQVPPDPPVVGILGRICETKGQLEFVRAAALVLHDHPKARFRLIGAPLFGHEGYEARVRAEAEMLGLGDAVEFAGFVEDPRAAIDALTVCVHASATPEPFGQVVVEAMARGVPVVATCGGGVSEIVEPWDREPLGALVPPGDVGALAAAICAVLADQGAARSLAARAQEYAVERFGIERTAAVVAEAWATALRARQPGDAESVRRRSPPRPPVPDRAPGQPSIAIAHDYLTQRGGAERVVLALMRAFPEAPIYTTLFEPERTYPEFQQATIITSPLNRIPFLRRHHRAALPLLPFAAYSLRIPHDVVVSSSSGWAHGFSTSGRTLSYCHAPARWLYQPETYLGGPPTRSAKGVALVALRPWLLRWDRRAARRPERYLANSTVVRDRIHDAYGIDADVVFPPHSVDAGGPQTPVVEAQDWAWDGYYLVVSRLLPYKNVQQVVEAFRQMEELLLVVGTGPLADHLRAGLPPNVRLVSNLTDAQIRWAYAHANALVAASVEDFGLTPLEAGAFGKPTLALRGGGYLDTIVAGLNGAFFDAPTPAAIRSAVAANRGRRWDAERIREHTETFGENRFRRRMRQEVESFWAS